MVGAYQGFGYEQIKVLFFILSITLIGFIWLFQQPKINRGTIFLRKINWDLIKISSGIFVNISPVLIDLEDQFGRMKFSLERVKYQTKSLKRQHS